jgi:hypothetical protein
MQYWTQEQGATQLSQEAQNAIKWETQPAKRAHPSLECLEVPQFMELSILIGACTYSWSSSRHACFKSNFATKCGTHVLLSQFWETQLLSDFWWPNLSLYHSQIFFFFFPLISEDQIKGTGCLCYTILIMVKRLINQICIRQF